MDTFHLILVWSGYAWAAIVIILGLGLPVVASFEFAQVTAKSQKLDRLLADDTSEENIYITDELRREGDRREGFVKSRLPFIGSGVIVALLSAILHRLVIT